MSDKYIGKFLDNRYEILQVIGTGGMAVVYKALCHRLKRHVAIKILKDEYAKDEEFRSRFRAESHAVAMLSHPNIVAVYDVSKSNSIEYIVMELIDGMTLKQYMERRGTLTQKEAIHFATQILKALSHAHEKGIIHRDIKPHNIMLLRDSTVKVADFGIARFESSQKTVTREAFGSVHYIAPEQAKGSHIDCRADIYSTGVVLYEMLTGRLPYEGDTPVSVAIQHINSLPLSPREINPEIPEALEKITMKAMAPSTAKRYASTEEMLADLEEYRKNPQVSINYELPVKGAEDLVDEAATQRVDIHIEPESEEEQISKPVNKFVAKIPLIATILSIAIFISGALVLCSTLFGWGKAKKVDKVTIPNVVGMTIEEARTKNGDFTFKEDKEASIFSDEYDANVIVSQTPEAGEQKGSRTITVILSRGKPGTEVKLRSVASMTEEQATRMLDGDGVVYEIRRENSDDVDAGVVIKTEPEAGSIVSSGEKVVLYISLGKEKQATKMPKIVGLSKEKAMEALENVVSEDNISVTEKHDEEVEKGIVISQSVEAGYEISENESISFVVSLGAEEKEEPKPEPEKEEPKPEKKPEKEPEPKPEPVPEKEPEQIDDGLVSKTQTIRLPESPESFVVKITVNDEVQYEKTHKGTDSSVSVTLQGKGECMVRIYIDDTLNREISMSF